MEILILIGIFAFVVAILFRSNEALTRVGVVEKEVKILESEGKQAEAPKADPVTRMFEEETNKEEVSQPVAVEQAQAIPEPVVAQPAPQAMYEPAFTPAPEAPVAVEQPIVETPPVVPIQEQVVQPAVENPVPEPAQAEAPAQATAASSDQSFPTGAAVHMN